MEALSVPEKLKRSQFYRYHDATKHTVERLRSHNHRLDWASQPNPFLHYEGARLIDLPHDFVVSESNFFETVARLAGYSSNETAQSDGSTKASLDFGLKFISNLLFYSMAVSAWKQVVGTNHRWALRGNASSGNLHPTDTYIITGRTVENLPAGLYHYRVDEHKLEERISGDLNTSILETLGMDCAPPLVMVALTSIFFRESWKYRDRGFRYCQHDLGHALAAIMLSAAALGWKAEVVTLFPDDWLKEVLQLSGDEVPQALILLSEVDEARRSDEFETSSERRILPSTPSSLSSKIIDYPSIAAVYQATKYSESDYREVKNELWLSNSHGHRPPGKIVAATDPYPIDFDLTAIGAECLYESVHKTIRKRRSAVDMDGKTGMEKAHVEYILRTATLGFNADFQSADSVVSGVWKSSSELHLVDLYIYVHRVSGLPRGLYFFDRAESSLVPLLLQDQREIAMSTSCFQEIASDGAFSVSMIADFVRGYQLFRDRAYKLVHYEAGYIGQMLYLAACTLGYDATGIGCFIDDAINNYLALNEGHEVIYNFTFGKAVHDPRLTTFKSYDFEYPDFVD
ncbi:MAG: SagB/ThcOx family dehydrogenase [Candidatus Obscuribacterales bacterium]|nr:SagB/ThcOx family dehydrogenase [Candidatus Obscuribacterales bacterium]